ncbi:unnamed protein product [Protopolystoma xenopodis]|uniref:Secreted protein n=1 Tax=Protopolystoma xenopodis TaxID=117903 RepID=A0A448XQ89_9PLAT|nr:unnamed protein product [Protopolystoma xenopodis]
MASLARLLAAFFTRRAAVVLLPYAFVSSSWRNGSASLAVEDRRSVTCLQLEPCVRLPDDVPTPAAGESSHLSV